MNSSDDRAGGIVVEGYDNYHTMSSNLYSGLVYSTDAAGALIGWTIASKDSADINNFSHGTIYGSSAGGLIGLTHNTNNPTIWLHQSYSTAFVFGDGSIGGLFGNYDYSHGRLEITKSHAKGYVTGTGLPAGTNHHAGGLIGSFIAQDDSSVTITDSFYEVVVSMTDDSSVLSSSDYISHGGVIGYINASGDSALSIENLFLSNKNTITAITRGHKAGIVGGIAQDDSTRVVLRNIDYSGIISSSEGQGVSGILGSLSEFFIPWKSQLYGRWIDVNGWFSGDLSLP